MSCSSSDDDGPAISSPDSSSKEDNDSDDEFDFACKYRNKFQKDTLKQWDDENSCLSPSSTSPSSQRRRKRCESDVVEDRLSAMERKKRFKDERKEAQIRTDKDALEKKRSACRLLQLSDDESDDGIEIVDVVLPTSTVARASTAAPTPPSSARAASGIFTRASSRAGSQGCVATRRSTRSQRNLSSPSSSQLSNTKKVPAASPLRRSPRRLPQGMMPPLAAAAAASVEVIIDDSSDEENDDPQGVSIYALKRDGASKDVVDTLQRSRQAAELLRNAQEHDTEDDEVEVLDEPVVTVPSVPKYGSAGRSASVASNNHTAAASMDHSKKAGTANRGKMLRLTCRTLIYKNGCSRPTPVDKVLVLGDQERLQLLRDKCLESHSLSPTSTTMTLKFDGIALGLSRTPASCTFTPKDPVWSTIVDVNSVPQRSFAILTRPLSSLVQTSLDEIEDEDMIEVEAKTTAVAHAQTTAKKILGPLLSLKLRRQNGKQVKEHILQHRQQEVFQDLMDRYRKQTKVAAGDTVVFRFDGDTLDMNKTPAAVDMESEDLIDVAILPAAGAVGSAATGRISTSRATAGRSTSAGRRRGVSPATSNGAGTNATGLRRSSRRISGGRSELRSRR